MKKANGKHLAFLLRHDKDYEFLPGGWRKIKDLPGFTKKEVEEIVRTDDKGRYEMSLDGSMVRALQGHSVEVDVGLEIKTPPDVLYHGTATRFLESIFKEGIKKMSRLYVQLSWDPETALEVGKRHGTPALLVVDTKRMTEDGVIFKLSKNNVWMTDYVDPKYIRYDRS